MPHIHALIALDEEQLRICPELAENLISAEHVHEPDPEDHSKAAEQARRLRRLVGELQTHTCSDYCMKDSGQCDKRFPKDYSNETIISERHAQYMRRAPEMGGAVYEGPTRGKARGTTTIHTNQYVVPYNPFILLKYGSHHNVEWVGSQHRALEYSLKYLLKGEF